MKESFRATFKAFDFSKFTKIDFLRVFTDEMTEHTADNLEKTFKSYLKDLEDKEYKLMDDKTNALYLAEKEAIKKKIFQLNETIYTGLEKVFNRKNFVQANTDENNQCVHCL
jgi:hypothetical protein